MLLANNKNPISQLTEQENADLEQLNVKTVL